MGQLADALRRDPENKDKFRQEGGRFDYGDPAHLLQDLVVTRRTWFDVTIVANDIPVEQLYGYLAFWDTDDPTLNFYLPLDAIRRSRRSEISDLFTTPSGRIEFLRRVEVQAREFDTSLTPEDRPTLWSRLMDDDLFS